MHDAQFSPDGRWLVTAATRAASGTSTEGERPPAPGARGNVTAAAFDPSGRIIVTGGDDGTVRTYRCAVCGGVDDLLALAGRGSQATRRELTPAERERYLG